MSQAPTLGTDIARRVGRSEIKALTGEENHRQHEKQLRPFAPEMLGPLDKFDVPHHFTPCNL